MWWMDEKPKKKIIIFLESEGVLNISGNETNNADSEWDSESIYYLFDVLKESNNAIQSCKIVTIGNSRKESFAKLQNQMNEYEREEYIADDIESFISESEKHYTDKVDEIKDYLGKHNDIANYVVVVNKSDVVLELSFPLHCVFANSKLGKRENKLIRRKTIFGTGWENEYMFSNKREIDDKFKKVIFLDIDGVLNKDHTSGLDDEEKVETEFVDNLAEIVDRTCAEIVLSSSWRYGFGSLDQLSEVETKLFKTMAERNLFIAGATPTIMNGPDGRPLEIKQWLSKRQSVISFVILDDEDFWSWRWISPYVVTTSYVTKEGRRVKRHSGLERRYVDRAVQILNQFDKAGYMPSPQ